MKRIKNAVRAVVTALAVATGLSAQAEIYTKYTYVSTQSLTPGGSATAYITLPKGLIADGDSVETRVQYKDAGATGTECVFCCRIGGTDKGFDLFRIKGEGYRVDYQGQFKSNPKLGLTTDEQVVTVGKTSLKVNDDTYSYTGGTLPSLSERAPILFVCDSSGNGIPSSNQAAMKMFYFRVKDKDGKAKIDLVPAGDSTGKLGLLDSQTGSFYAFEGTDSAKVEHGEVDNTVNPPIVYDELPYTGEEQIGVMEGQDYTLSDTWKATEINTYTAKATLKSGKVWSDTKTSEVRTLNWSIVKGVNKWTKFPYITETRFRPGDTNVQLTPGATQHGTVVATIRKDGGDPIAFDGRLSTLELGEYELTYTSVADDHYVAAAPVEKSVHFVVTENPDDFNLPAGYTRVGYLSSYENWTSFSADSPYMVLSNANGSVKIDSTDQLSLQVQILRLTGEQGWLCQRQGTFFDKYIFKQVEKGLYIETQSSDGRGGQVEYIASVLSAVAGGVFDLSTTYADGKMTFLVNGQQIGNPYVPVRPYPDSSKHPLMLFGKCYAGGSAVSNQTNFACSRLYDLQITDKDGVLLHRLVPCVRDADDVVGLYDVTDTASGDHFYREANPARPFTAEEKIPVVVSGLKTYPDGVTAAATVSVKVMEVGENVEGVELYALYGLEDIFTRRTRISASAHKDDLVTCELKGLDYQNQLNLAIEVITDKGDVYTNFYGKVTLPNLPEDTKHGPMDFENPTEVLDLSGERNGVVWTKADRAYVDGSDIVLVYTNVNEAAASFEVKGSEAKRIRLLVLAGGGAGGTALTANSGMPGGGGGAGGMISKEFIMLPPGAYDVKVGAGAQSGEKNGNGQTVTGGDSTVMGSESDYQYRAIGGGGGGCATTQTYPTADQIKSDAANNKPFCGLRGGSTGGVLCFKRSDNWGGWIPGTDGTLYQSTFCVSGQGNPGGRVGNFNNNYGWWSAGGGGAGAWGSAADMAKGNYVFGAGGKGRASGITGENIAYAGGGAGGCVSTASKDYTVPYTVGGGGGSGASAQKGAYSNPGVDGLGGGGAGGSYHSGEICEPGRGGNGAVVVRFEGLVSYRVSFDYGVGTASVTPPVLEGIAYNGDLPVYEWELPHADGKEFVGYFGPDGLQYYDEKGNPLRPYGIAGDATLTARYADGQYRVSCLKSCVTPQQSALGLTEGVDEAGNAILYKDYPWYSDQNWMTNVYKTVYFTWGNGAEDDVLTVTIWGVNDSLLPIGRDDLLNYSRGDYRMLLDFNYKLLDSGSPVFLGDLHYTRFHFRNCELMPNEVDNEKYKYGIYAGKMVGGVNGKNTGVGFYFDGGKAHAILNLTGDYSETEVSLPTNTDIYYNGVEFSGIQLSNDRYNFGPNQGDVTLINCTVDAETAPEFAFQTCSVYGRNRKNSFDQPPTLTVGNNSLGAIMPRQTLVWLNRPLVLDMGENYYLKDGVRTPIPVDVVNMEAAEGSPDRIRAENVTEITIPDLAYSINAILVHAYEVRFHLTDGSVCTNLYAVPGESQLWMGYASHKQWNGYDASLKANELPDNSRGTKIWYCEDKSTVFTLGTVITSDRDLYEPTAKAVSVTITGNTLVAEYDGQEHKVSGFTFTCEGEGAGDFKAEDLVWTSKDGAVTNLSSTVVCNLSMGLKVDQFSVKDSSKFNATFEVVQDGGLTILPLGTDTPLQIRVPVYTNIYNGSVQTVPNEEIVVHNKEKLLSGDVLSWTLSGSRKDAGGPTEVSVATYTIKRGSLDVTSCYVFDTPPTVSGSITITKRLVRVFSGSAEKTYDGLPLTKNEVGVEGSYFASGEGIDTYNCTGSQTDAGQGYNTFTYTLKSNTDLNNYDKWDDRAGLLTVNPKSVVPEDVSCVHIAAIDPVVYNGQEQKPTVVVTDTALGMPEDRQNLVEGRDYECVYSDNVNVGTATVTLNFKGNYKDSLTKTFIITAKPAGELTVGEIADEMYDGEAHEPKPVVKDGEKVLAEDRDYTLSWENNVNAADKGAASGAPTVTVTFKGNYSGTRTRTFTIAPRPVEIKTGSTSFSFDGKPHAYTNLTAGAEGFAAGEGFATTSNWATVTTVDEGAVDNTCDYTVSYKDGSSSANYLFTTNWGKISILSAGEARIVITGATVTAVYDGTPKTATGWFISEAPATLDRTKVAIGDSAKSSVTGTDADTYTMAMTADDFSCTDPNFSKFTFDVTPGTLTITAKPADTLTVGEIADEMYDGEAHEPKPVVKDGEKTLAEGKDYTLSYADNVNAADKDAATGAPTVTVTFKGNYSGTRTRTFTIAPRPVKLQSADGTWVYDGEAHSTNEVFVAKDSLYKFVDGEGVESFTDDSFPTVKEVADTAPDGKPNTFAVKTLKLNADSIEANYVITCKPGKLMITGAGLVTVKVRGNTKTSEFNRLEQYVEGWEFVSSSNPLFTKEAIAFSGTARVTATNVRADNDGKWMMGLKEADYSAKDATTFPNVKFEIEDGWLKLTPKAINELQVVLEPESYVYNGEERSISIAHVYDKDGAGNQQELILDKDYTLSGETSGVDVKVYDALLTGIGNHTGTKTVKWSITRRPVKLVSETGSVPYDGTAHTWKATPEDKVEGDYLGLVPGEEFGYTDFPSFTFVSETKDADRNNTFEVVEKSPVSGKKSNYSFELVPGTVRITPRQGPNGEKLVVTAKSDSRKYDGTPLTNPGFTWTDGVLADGDYAAATVEGSITDCGTAANVVTAFSVTNSAGAVVTDNYVTGPSVNGELKIEKRLVTITSGSASHAYDGTPAENHALPAITGDGFADGEGIENYKATGSQLEKGTSDNDFTYDLKANTKAANYTITPVKGKLTITDSEDTIVVTSEDHIFAYDGEAHAWPVTDADESRLFQPDHHYQIEFAAAARITYPTEGEVANMISNLAVTNEAGEVITGYKLQPVHGKLTMTNAVFDIDAASYGWSGVYDGQLHGIAVTVEKIAELGFKGIADGTLKLQFSESGADGSWRDAPYTYKDVKGDAEARTVWFKVSAPYYDDFVGSATVTITKRPIAFASNPVTATYDGQPHQDTTVTVSPDPATADAGFVSGEGATFSGFMSFTDYSADARPNTFDVNWNDGTTANNYAVTKVEGPVTIDRRDIGETGDDWDVRTKGQLVYNGALQTQEMEAFTFKGGEVTYGVKDQSNQGKDAGGYTMTVEGTGNFTGTREIPWSILRREVTFTADSAEKPYDGTPLTKPTVSVANMAPYGNESATAAAVGSQTAKGSSANKVDEGTIAWTNAKASNYTVKTVDGTLTVTANSANRLTLAAKSDSRKYNGEALENGGWDLTAGQLMAGDRLEVTVKGTITHWTADGAANRVESYRVLNAAGEDVTDSYVFNPCADGTLTIEKRVITLVSGSATWPYDGAEHGKDEVTVKSGEGLDDFVAGEGYAATCTTKVKDPVVNRDNEFTYTLNEGTREGDYAITREYGKLTVTTSTDTILINTKSQTFCYDGEAHDWRETDAAEHQHELKEAGQRFVIDWERGGFTPASISIPGKVTNGLPDANVRVLDAAGNDVTDRYTIQVVPGELTMTNAVMTVDPEAVKGVEVFYDAEKHTLAVDESKFPTLVGGVRPTIAFGESANAITLAEAPEYDQAGTYTVWYALSSPYYTTVTNSADVIIKKRTVKFWNEDAHWTYDSRPHANETVVWTEFDSATGAGFISGESVTFSGWPVLTNVADGSELNKKKNAFAVTWDNASESNYDWSKEEKFAWIDPVDLGVAQAAGKVVITLGEAPKYNGQYQTIAIESVTYKVDDGLTLTLAQGSDYTIENETDKAKHVNPDGGLTINGKDNYVNKANAPWSLKPRTVQFRSKSASRTYNGQPLTCHEYEIVEGMDGFVGSEKEAILFTWTGTQTTAGSSDNTYTWAVDPNSTVSAADYDFKDDLYGTLTVNKATYPGKITWTPSGTTEYTYDGKEHAFSVEGVPEGVTYVLTGHVGTNWLEGGYLAHCEITSYDETNYEKPLAPADFPWWILKRQITLSSEDITETYGGQTLTTRVNGDNYVEGECFKYTDLATLDHVGETDATFNYTDSDDAKTLVSNYNVTLGKIGKLKLEPNAMTVTVTAHSGEWTFDNEYHFTNGWTATNTEILNSDPDGTWRDVVVAKVDTEKFRIKYPTEGPKGDGVTSNWFDVAETKIVRRYGDGRPDSDVTKNYNFALMQGVLKVNKATVPIDDVGGEASAFSYTGKYDGDAHGIAVTVEPPVQGGAFDIGYALAADGPFGGIDATRLTDVGKQTVWYVVSADYYVPYTNNATVAVTQRSVTLTSSSREKVADGTPLYTALADEGGDKGIAIGGDGFAKSEGCSFKNPAHITTVAESPAAADFDYDLINGAKAANYRIEKSLGTLTIKKDANEIVFKAKSFTREFNGQPLALREYETSPADISGILTPGDYPVVEFDPESTVTYPTDGPKGDGVVSNVITEVKILRPVSGGEPQDVTGDYTLSRQAGVLKILPATIDWGEIDVRSFSVVTNYDGEEHSIRVEKPTVLTEPVTVAYATQEDGPYAAGEASNPGYKDANGYTTYYVVSAPHYRPYTNSATVTISPRAVTYLSGSATNTYDGVTKCICHAATLVEGSLDFVSGESHVFSYSGERLEEGTSENTFEVNWGASGAKQDNYSMTYLLGELKVLSADIPLAKVEDYEGVYDAAAHGVTVVSTLPTAEYWFADVPDDESAYALEPVTRTNVGETKVYIKIKPHDHNYHDCYTNALVKIAAKPLLVESGDRTFPYDGEPHAFTNLTVTGLVGGDCVASTSNWATVTALDEAKANACDWTFGCGELNPLSTLANYAVTTNWGTIKIGQQTAGVIVTITGACDTVTYDGLRHDVSGWGIASIAGEGAAGYLPEYVDVKPGCGWMTATNGIHAGTYTMAMDANTFTNLNSAFAQVAFEVAPGVLAINRKPVDDDSGVTVGPVEEDFFYNGEGHEPEPSVTDVKTGSEQPVEGGDFKYVYEDNTNATDTATVIVDFNQPDGNYSGAITNEFAISPRTVTLESGSETFVYDGQAHSNLAVTATAYDGDATPDRGHGFVPGEGFTSNVTGRVRNVSDTHEGNNAFTYELADGTLAMNYVVTTTNGTLTVVKRGGPDDPDEDKNKLHLKPLHEAIDFGEPVPEQSTYTWTVVTGLVEGDTEDQVQGTAAYETAYTQGASVGDYAIELSGLESENYELAYDPGVLTVKAAKLPDPQPKEREDDPSEPKPEGYEGTPFDWYGCYDGNGHTILDLQFAAGAVLTTPRVLYSATAGEGYAEDLVTFVDVTNRAPVYVKVEADNYEPLYTNAFVTITQRVVHVEFPKVTKVYDGTDACPAPGFVVTNLATEAENMVAGEEIDAEGRGHFDTPNVDASAFIVTNVTLTAVGEKTKLSNYLVFVGANGGLLFSTDGEGSGPVTYDGDDPRWPGEPDGPAAIEDAKLPDPQPKEREDDPSEPKPEGYEGTPFDWYGCYDGNGHTILDFQFAAGAVLTEPRVLYSATAGEGYAEELVTFVDVTNRAPVYVKIEAENYGPLYTNAFVTITQRVVHVEFPKVTKVYDGTDACPAPGFVVTNLATEAENMVAGEEIDAEGRGHFDTPNVDASAFIVTNVTLTAVGEKTKLSNYLVFVGANGGLLFSTDGEGAGPVTYDGDDPRWPGEPEGPAEIVPARLPDPQPKEREDDPSEPKPEGYEGTPFDWYGCYDGLEHTILEFVFAPGAVLTEPRVLYSRTEGTGYGEDLVTFVDVTNKAPVYVKVEADNYEPLYTNAFVTITPRSIALALVSVTNNPAGGKIKLGDKLVFTAVDATLPAGSVDLTAADYGEPVWVNTNKVSKPGQTAKLILNGQGNYKDAVTNEFWIYARIAELKAKLAWRQNLGTGKLYAQVRIGCGNLSDDPDPIDQMAFVFPGVDTVPVLRLDKPDTTVDGVPAVTMGTGAVNEMISSKVDWSALYGVSDATFAAPVRTTPVPKAERLIALGSGNFLEPDDPDNRLFVLWYKSGDEERRVYMTTGEFASRLVTMRATVRSVTAKDVNDYLAYSLDPESSKNCRLKAFTVTDGTVHGSVAVLDDDGNEAKFGDSVRITLLRADAPDGVFKPVDADEVTVDAEGSFAAKLKGEPNGFFRARVVVDELVK